MKTDRELIELAAKAYGIDWENVLRDNGSFVEDGRVWDPLVNDGDALRLAVRLEINILPSMEITETRNPSLTGWIKERSLADPYAATRRAIVRAAAAIGAQMTGEQAPAQEQPE